MKKRAAIRSRAGGCLVALLALVLAIAAAALKLPLPPKPKLPVGADGSLYAAGGPTPVFILGDVDYSESEGGISLSSSESPDNRFVLSFTMGAGYAHIAGPLKDVCLYPLDPGREMRTCTTDRSQL